MVPERATQRSWQFPGIPMKFLQDSHNGEGAPYYSKGIENPGVESNLIEAMVVKTDLCSFSEFRVYPGHGIRFIRRDGQPLTFSSSKSKSLYNNRKKPAKLTWTQSWRRLNKKGKEEGVMKKKNRRVVKIQRAIVGATLEELSKKRQVSKPVSVATEAALKEVKDRAKASAKKSAVARPSGSNVPKVQRPIHNNRGGSRR